MSRDLLLELLRDAQAVHHPPVHMGMPVPDRGWTTMLALVNAVPDLIRELEENS